jgi:hypothetical protein
MSMTFYELNVNLSEELMLIDQTVTAEDKDGTSPLI